MAKVHSWLTSQDSKLWSATARLGAIFGVITPLITVPVLVITEYSFAPAMILAVYVCLLSTALIVLLVRQENRYLREMRYAAALLPMRKAFSEVAYATWNLFHSDSSQTAFRLRLRESLRRFAEAFTLVTGTQCRACIKLIQAPAETSEHDMLISTLCRDNEGIDPPRHAPDRIGDNTDFKQIFTEAKANFFCNDLPGMLSHGYKNSHWDERAIDRGEFDYRATIVWPIERGDPSELGRQEPREIIGFLCIDTLEVNTFHETYDRALGAAFAQALYLALHRFREASGDSSSANAGPERRQP